VETYLIKREEPMRPRRREKARVALCGGPSSLGNGRNPSIILNAGFLACALTESNGGGRMQNFQNNHHKFIGESCSRSHSQIDLAHTEDSLQNVSGIKVDMRREWE